MHPRRPWLGTVLGSVLWLTTGGLAGYIAASLGGHGSVIFLVVGALVGVSGAVYQAVVHLVRHSRRSSWLAQTVDSWCGTMVLSAGLLVCFALATGGIGHVGDQGLLLLLAALPALLVSGLISWVVSLAA